MAIDMSSIIYLYIIFNGYYSYSYAQNIRQVQCLDSCMASPALLGRELTISDCCGSEGRNGGGFILPGADACINCTTPSAEVVLTTDPVTPILGGNLTLSCQVKVDDLLDPSGILLLQLSNGSVISGIIKSTVTTILLDINLFTGDDIGRYYCNASITSLEFPNTFQDANLSFFVSSIINSTSSTNITIESSSGPKFTKSSDPIIIPTPTTPFVHLITTSIPIPTIITKLDIQVLTSVIPPVIVPVTTTASIAAQNTPTSSTTLNIEDSKKYFCRNKSPNSNTQLMKCEKELNNCHQQAKCTDFKEGSKCVCNPGYSGDGNVCIDVDECLTGISICHPHAVCQNFSGGYLCTCPNGFLGNGIKCYHHTLSMSTSELS